MADEVVILPNKVFVKVEAPKVKVRVETPSVPARPTTHDIPVLVAPGKQGPPGKDGAVIGGAVIEDGPGRPDRVWSSEYTNDRDIAVVDSLDPQIDLTLLFNNALA